MIHEYPWWKQLFLNYISSVIFYTTIPLPYIDKLDFSKVACLAPQIGVTIGGSLGILDIFMSYLGIPVLTRSALVVAIWIAITGGLHLDGAIDTADGLAVTDQQRRLEVMADSVTGAFGAMTVVVIVLLKTVALTDIHQHRWLLLIAACGWGRWGQQLAILRYPYLKPTGKGALHKQAINSYKDLLPGLFLLMIVSNLTLFWHRDVILALAITIAGSAIAFFTGAWFNYKLAGHTGDTYGAVVEWTEALFLCALTVVG